MSIAAISARGIEKVYQLGSWMGPATTFREAVTRAGARLLRPRPASAEAGSKFHALKDVSFDVRPGEVVGVVGKNGAGKSTLLKILSRITEPSAGEIRVRGRLASLLEVGTGFHPDLTGRENIYLNGAILGMGRAEIRSKFDAIVAFSEVEKFLDTPVKRYSSGMYVRLAFSVAAHLDPDILIIDEVLAVGDSSFQRKCLGKMKEVTTCYGRTVLFVSHNLTTVRSLCDRAIWLDRGELVEDGPAAEVVDAYLGTETGGDRLEFNLAEVDRPSWANRPSVRLVKATLNGGEPIRHGQPLGASLAYQAMADAEDVSFHLGLSSSDQACKILSVDTDVPGERFDILKATRGRVEIVVPTLDLQPGRYILDLGVRSSDNHWLDYLRGIAQVEVLAGPTTPDCIVGRTTNGGMRVRSEWRHLPQDADGGARR